jgi:hypothetical protein
MGIAGPSHLGRATTNPLIDIHYYHMPGLTAMPGEYVDIAGPTDDLTA